MSRFALVPLLALLVPTPAAAVTLNLLSETTPSPGVTLREYDTDSPNTNTWVALIDLCTEYVHVDATRAPSGLQSTGSWGEDEGVQLATNGDFYRTGPVRIYGNAVGRGLPWPLEQIGDDPGDSWEWSYQNYGWIAFGPDFVEFTHSEWVKNNPGVFGGLADGWMSDTVAPPIRPGTIGLVSGFPELVIEGAPFECSSLTADDCFPDRTDMRSRHPRTAMGITADRSTFILAVVDGRTSASSGMYGAELADLMFQLGAWEAFNLDGGGSSQMWTEDDGYVNDISGNNSGGGTRSVGNHWGVFAGIGGGRPERPGHCESLAPCQVIPPEGGIVDDEGACFEAFGPPQYWREEDAGNDGHLLWTNAFSSDQASNWAWWQLHPEEAGEYLVEYWAEPEFAVFDAVPYVVRTAGVDHDLVVDQSGADGWTELGTFDFDAGAEQWVAVYDAVDGSVGSDQHIVADAIRLTRLNWTPPGDDDDTTPPPDDDDTTPPPDDDDSAVQSDDDDFGPVIGDRRSVLEDPAGCGCGESSGASYAVLLVLLGAPIRRRRPPRAGAEHVPPAPRRTANSRGCDV